MNIVYNHDMVISMLIETSLLFKTIVILSMQLGLVLFSCFYFLRKAKEAYQKNTTLLGLSFRGSVNMKGKLDLIPFVKQKDTFPKRMGMYVDKNNTLIKEAKNQDEVIKLIKEGYSHAPEGGGPLVGLMIFWMIALYTTAAVTSFYLLSLWQTMFLFSLTSISFGPLLAFVMLEMDENDGFTALKIVLMVTILTGFIDTVIFILSQKIRFLEEFFCSACLLYYCLISLVFLWSSADKLLDWLQSQEQHYFHFF